MVSEYFCFLFDFALNKPGITLAKLRHEKVGDGAKKAPNKISITPKCHLKLALAFRRILIRIERPGPIKNGA